MLTYQSRFAAHLASLGWPGWFAHLADAIHEGLPRSEAPAWGTALHAIMPTGIDLDALKAPILLCIQRRNLARVIDLPTLYAEMSEVEIRRAIGVLEGFPQGSINPVIGSAAGGLDRPAEMAAASARAAVRGLAVSAGWSAWWAAESAWAVERSLPARATEYQTQRDDILRLIQC